MCLLRLETLVGVSPGAGGDFPPAPPLVSLSVSLYLCIFLCASLYLSLCLYVFIHLSLWLSVCLLRLETLIGVSPGAGGDFPPAPPLVSLSVSLYLCIFLCASFYLSLCLSVFIHLSLCLSVSLLRLGTLIGVSPGDGRTSP